MGQDSRHLHWCDVRFYAPCVREGLLETFREHDHFTSHGTLFRLEARNRIFRRQAALIRLEDINVADRRLEARWLVETGKLPSRDLQREHLEVARTYQRVGFGRPVHRLVPWPRAVQCYSR